MTNHPHNLVLVKRLGSFENEWLLTILLQSFISATHFTFQVTHTDSKIKYFCYVSDIPLPFRTQNLFQQPYITKWNIVLNISCGKDSIHPFCPRMTIFQPTLKKRGGNKKKKGGLVQPHMRKHEQFIKPISSKPLIIFDVGLHLQLYVRYPVSDGSANHFLRR